MSIFALLYLPAKLKHARTLLSLSANPFRDVDARGVFVLQLRCLLDHRLLLLPPQSMCGRCCIVGSSYVVAASPILTLMPSCVAAALLAPSSASSSSSSSSSCSSSSSIAVAGWRSTSAETLIERASSTLDGAWKAGFKMACFTAAVACCCRMRGDTPCYGFTTRC